MPADDEASARRAELTTGEPHLARPAEEVLVRSRRVSCDGVGGALGHPRVFLHIEDRSVLCPYCSRLYVLNEGAGHASGH